MSKQGTKDILIECAVVIVVSFILSFIVIVKMPYGGGVTLACMLPLIVLSYRQGLLWGLLSAFVFSLLQLAAGFHNVSNASDTVSAVEIVLLDYILAYTVVGIVGWWKRQRPQTSTVVTAGIFVCFLRFVFHVLAGATAWVNVSIPTVDGMVNSIIYNMAYMIPETVITVYLLALLSYTIDFRKDKPVVKKRNTESSAIAYSVFFFCIAIVADFNYLFWMIQSKEGFDVTRIHEANPMIIGVITMVGIAMAVCSYFMFYMFANKNEGTK